MHYGIQLYSVRDLTQSHGVLETLRRVAEIGYKSVEFAGFGASTTEEVRAELDALDLSVDGAHIGINALSPEMIEQTMKDLKTVGCNRIIIPAAKVNTMENINIFLEKLRAALPRLTDAGFEVGYHNHDFEYLPNEDGIIPMRVIEEKTNLFFELDTYWAYHAGLDPVAEMERMGKRLRMIHLKDGIPALGKESGKPLGEGNAPVKKVYETALAKGLPIIVESETLTPDGPTEALVCYRYLKSIEA